MPSAFVAVVVELAIATDAPTLGSAFTLHFSVVDAGGVPALVRTNRSLVNHSPTVPSIPRPRPTVTQYLGLGGRGTEKKS